MSDLTTPHPSKGSFSDGSGRGREATQLHAWIEHIRADVKAGLTPYDSSFDEALDLVSALNSDLNETRDSLDFADKNRTFQIERVEQLKALFEIAHGALIIIAEAGGDAKYAAKVAEHLTEAALSTPEAVKGKPAHVLRGDDIERMVDAMVAQSTAYPVVPPGYEKAVEPLRAFTARQCLLAALREVGIPNVVEY